MSIDTNTRVIPMQAFILPTLWLLSGCQQDTFRVGEVDFVQRILSLGRGSAAAVADLDNDGHQDLVISVDGNELAILLGDGKGGLSGAGQVAAGENPTDLALADLNADGNVDVVVANHETKHLTILLGDGRGALQAAPNSPLTIDVSPHPHVVRAADLDGDGHLDLVVDHRDGQGLLIIRGSGSGEFASPGQLVEVGGDPYLGMAIGDLNSDGQPDLVTPNPREVGVVLSTDQKQFEFAPATSVAAPAPFAVALADLNGDAKLDLIAASDDGSPSVQLFWGDGQGAFQEAEGSPFRFAAGAKIIASGDFNGDGVADAAVASYVSSDVLILLGGPSSIRTAYLPGGVNPWSLVAVDLNEDGKDDLVIADDASDRVTIYLSR